MINIKESLKFGWKVFWKNWPPFIVLSLLLAIITVVLSDKDIFSIKSIFNYVGMSIVSLGFYTLSLKVVDGKKVDLSDIFDNYKLLVPFSLVSITCLILFDLGLFLLIIPALFIGARTFAAPFLVIDKNTSYADSFKKSWKLTQRKTIKLIFFEITLFIVAILGLIAFLIGALVAAPIMSIASAYIYRKLSPR